MGDDPAFDQWEGTDRRRQQERTAPLERLKRQVVQRELDQTRAQKSDVTVELDTGELRLLSEITPAEEARVVATHPVDLWPWEPDEDQDPDDDEPR